MATPNYSFEKRKRELAKKTAKEAKRLRKGEKTAAAETGDVSETSGASEEPSANPLSAPPPETVGEA